MKPFSAPSNPTISGHKAETDPALASGKGSQCKTVPKPLHRIAAAEIKGEANSPALPEFSGAATCLLRRPRCSAGRQARALMFTSAAALRQTFSCQAGREKWLMKQIVKPWAVARSPVTWHLRSFFHWQGQSRRPAGPPQMKAASPKWRW